MVDPYAPLEMAAIWRMKSQETFHRCRKSVIEFIVLSAKKVWAHDHFLPTTIAKTKWRLKEDCVAFMALAFNPSSSQVYVWYKIRVIPHKAPFNLINLRSPIQARSKKKT